MLASVRTVASLLLGTVLLLLGVGLLNTLIPLRAEALGFSLVQVGTLTSVYYAGYFAGTFLLPPLVHRIGHIRAFAFCTALVALLVLLQTLGENYWFWLLLRTLQGLALVGLYAIIESWLNAAAEPEHRNPLFSIYMMLNLGSLAAAQQFLRVEGEAWLLFAVVAALVCAATLPVAATRQAQPRMQDVPRVDVVGLYRRVPTALASALLSGLVMGALWGLLPVHARAAGLDTADIGTYMSAAILGGVALQWPLGRFADRVDRRLALAAIGAAAAAVAAAALMLPAAGMGAASALIFVFGGLGFTVYPVAVAHLVDYLPRERLLSGASTVLLVFGLGSALGPLLAGAWMNRAGAGVLFAWFMVLNLMMAMMALYRFATRTRIPVVDDHFVPMLRTTPAVLDLHPDTPGGPEDKDPASDRDEAPSAPA